ncbi:RNA-guided endonuclease TnpB family protein [Streptomyces tubercidicus]|uniref:RNA-guided endonuclease TnpB family protein n=1 Tax=Streptomyces tubercidicus TaxID=47759 RepID=UPI0036B6F36F
MTTATVLRAFRFALDPRPDQVHVLENHAGAARWAYNHSISAKRAAHDEWRRQVDAAVAAGTPEERARKDVKVPVPNKASIQKSWVISRGDSRDEVKDKAAGICPWWHEVNSHAFQSAWIDADAAWKAWIASFRGARAGRRVGYPVFKKKGKSRDSFRLHHDVKRPSIRLETYRRLRLPKVGEVRLHESAKRLGRLIQRGDAVVQSVTVSRGGSRWYASVLCKVQMALPEQPTRRQKTAGTVGVHLGINPLATLSKPWRAGDIAHSVVPNPRVLDRSRHKIVKAQRALSRTTTGSNRRAKAARRVGRLQHLVAEQRSEALHQITKRLATGFETVALYDMDVLGLTASPKRRKGRQETSSDLNRRLLDVAPAEFRRQVAYKTSWYGSQIALLKRDFHASKTCSSCGRQKPSLTLAERVFHCDHCNLRLPRGVNSARNIAAHAVVGPTGPVASREGETKNARGAPVRLPVPRDEQQGAVKREDTCHSARATPVE